MIFFTALILNEQKIASSGLTNPGWWIFSILYNDIMSKKGIRDKKNLNGQHKNVSIHFKILKS